MPTYEELVHAAYLLGLVDAQHYRPHKQLHHTERQFQTSYDRGYYAGRKKLVKQ